MWGVPRDYHPNMNAPAAQSDEYVTDSDWESHHVPVSHQDKVLRPFPPAEPTEPDFDYDIAKAHSEFFLKLTEAQYRPLAEGEEVPTLADFWHEHFIKGAELDPDMVDQANEAVTPLFEETPRRLPDLMDIADALGHLQKVLPDDHPDIVNLRAAAHEILQHPELVPQPEDFGVEWTESKLGSGDPYEVDLFGDPRQEVGEMECAAADLFEQPETAFEQQMQTLDDLLQSPELDLDAMPATEPPAGLDAVVEPADGYTEPGGLEQMIQENAFGAAPMDFADELPDTMESPMGNPLVANSYGLTPEDEINQAMSQAAGLREQELDPFAVAQQMFEEQMQYMDNPFLMPGMGPMPGM
jgi:hypothetical protein